MRKLDPQFEPTERPFCRFAHEKYRDDRLHYDAIVIRACAVSVNREKYSEPEQVVDPSWPKYNGIAYVEAGNMPPPQSGGDPPRVYVIEPADDPLDGNLAHAELRVALAGEPYEPKLRLGGAVIKRFRIAIADRMTVLRPPTSLEQ